MGHLLVGTSRELLSTAESLGYTILACVSITGSENHHGLVTFLSDEAAIASGPFDGVILAIDNPSLRERLFARYREAGLHIQTLMAGLNPYDSILGEGIISQRNAFIGPNCHLGDGVRLNIGACILGNTIVDKFVTLAPRATVLENVRIGARSYVGANATLLPGTIIGADCIIGAAAVVSGHISDHSVIKGNHAA